MDIRWQSPHFIFHTRGPYPFPKSYVTFFPTHEQSIWFLGCKAVWKAQSQHRGSPITTAFIPLRQFSSFVFPFIRKGRSVTPSWGNTCNRGKSHFIVTWTPYAMTWWLPWQKNWLPECPSHFNRGKWSGEERGLVWHLTI